MSAPTKEFLTYGEVIRWFVAEGLSESYARQLMEGDNPVIKGMRLRTQRKIYCSTQIQRDVFLKLNPDEGPASNVKAAGAAHVANGLKTNEKVAR